MSDTIKTILYATDLSEKSLNVFQMALGLAQKHEARILFFHVIEPLNNAARASMGVYFPSGELERLYDESMEEAYNNINAQMEKLYKGELNKVMPSMEFQSFILEGVPDQVIVKSAQKMGVDLIVMGSHSHGALEKLLVGSVANKVINQCALPVLLVPTAKR